MHLHATSKAAISIVALLSASVSAQGDQAPLFAIAKGWYQAAKDILPKPAAAPAGPRFIKQPIDAVATELAGKKVTPLTVGNYEDYFGIGFARSSQPVPTEYMLYITGGNKTCGGYCHNVDVAWNATAAILAVDPTAPKMASLDCDSQNVLCTILAASPPTVWFIQRPEIVDKPTDIYVNYFNVSTVSSENILALHTGKKYEDGILLKSYFHPFDGLFAQYGVAKPLGYLLWGLGLIPNWAFMILISMGSRLFLHRRNAPNVQAQRAAAQQAAAHHRAT